MATEKQNTISLDINFDAPDAHDEIDILTVKQGGRTQYFYNSEDLDIETIIGLKFSEYMQGPFSSQQEAIEHWKKIKRLKENPLGRYLQNAKTVKRKRLVGIQFVHIKMKSMIVKLASTFAKIVLNKEKGIYELRKNS